MKKDLTKNEWNYYHEYIGPKNDDTFGENIAIFKDYAVISDIKNNCAYLFHINDTVSEYQDALKLNPKTQSNNNNESKISNSFGCSIGITQSYVIIGEENNKNGMQSGAVYVFYLENMDT